MDTALRPTSMATKTIDVTINVAIINQVATTRRYGLKNGYPDAGAFAMTGAVLVSNTGNLVTLRMSINVLGSPSDLIAMGGINTLPAVTTS